MSVPTLRLPILRQWSSAPGITAGLRRMLEEDTVLVLPASLSEAEQGEIVDLLVLYLDMPVRVVASPEEARPGELSLLAFPVVRAPPGVAKGVLVCFKRRAHTTRRLEITDKIITLRDAVIQSIGRQYSGKRLMAVANWAFEAADSPSTALSFAAGAFDRYRDDPTADDATLYAAGLAGAVAGLLRGVSVRLAEWMIAFATGAPHPGRLVSTEAQLLGEEAAILRGLDAGLVLLAPEKPGDSLELRRPLETLRHLDTLMVTLTLGEVAKALNAVLDPRIRLVLERLLRTDRKPLGLDGPRPPRSLLGREEVIQRLVTLFEPASEIRTTVLYGVSGVGKPQVAAAVCNALAGHFETVWVRFAEGPEAGWMRVADALEGKVNPAKAATRDRDGVPQWVRHVHDELRFLPCLLVVEGVDAVPEDDLPAWLPRGYGTSAVLVLSRSAQRPLQRAHDAIAVRLGGLALEASRQLLAAKVASLREAILGGEADTLIDQVGGSPGALTLAASRLQYKTLQEVTNAVRRGKEGIPVMVRDVIGDLEDKNPAEAALLQALALCVPQGSPPDLALRMVGGAENDGWREALNRLVDRDMIMIVDGGRTVRLVEVVRLEVERRLDQKKEKRLELEAAHARETLAMFSDSRKSEDAQKDLYGDLVLATERATSLCKGGERKIVETVAGVANELLSYPGGDTGKNAQLAVEAYEAALAVAPENTAWQRGLSVGYDNVGNSLRLRSDTTAALVAYRTALDIRERLVRQDSANAEWQHDLSVSHDKIGDVLHTQGDWGSALAMYRTSLRVCDRLVQRDPANMERQHDLSVSYNKVGNVLLAQGDPKRALEAYRDSLAIAERLDPVNMQWQRDLSWNYNKIGDVLFDQEDNEGALSAYNASLAIAKRWAKKNPADTTWKRQLSVSHNKIGNLLLTRANNEAALAAYQAALAIRVSLVQQNPAITQWQRDLSVSHNKLGSVLLAQGDKAGASAAYQASLAIREHLARQDPAHAEWQADLAEACWKLAEALPTDTPAERTEVRAYLERARRIVGDLAASSRLTHKQQAWLPKIEAALRALPS